MRPSIEVALSQREDIKGCSGLTRFEPYNTISKIAQFILVKGQYAVKLNITR
jgi:hypothetical protein